MIFIEETEFEKIVRYFDLTINEHSHSHLRAILKDKPNNVDSIKTKQESFLLFASKLSSTFPISYFKSELEAIYNFTIDQYLFSKGQFIRNYVFNMNNYDRKVSLVRSTISFWSKIFDLLEPYDSEISHFYSTEVTEMITFLKKMDIPILKEKAKKGKLKFNDIVQFQNKLSSKDGKRATPEFWKQYYYFEALLSIAFVIKKQELTFPKIANDTKNLNLTGLYYPFAKFKSVKNNFELNKNIVLLTGPNMSGKSTLLKTIGISIYLGNLGIAIPAGQNSTIPFYDNIFVFIDHQDDVDSGLSHFMKELQRFKKVVESLSNGKSCFAVFDEIFQGTNISESASITQFSLRKLSTFDKGTFFISTHFYEIFNEEFINQGILQPIYLDCKIENERPIFSYELKEGYSTLKIGFLLFQLEGLYDLLK